MAPEVLERPYLFFCRLIHFYCCTITNMITRLSQTHSHDCEAINLIVIQRIRLDTFIR